MKIALMGSQGVGKGTYASELSKKLKIPHISTGDLFRAEKATNSVLGKKYANYMDQGKLVPDNHTFKMLLDRLSKKDAKKGFLLDGFPRNKSQAEKFDKIMKIDAVILFSADDQIIIERLSGRVICRQCQSIFNLKKLPPKVKGVCDHCNGELYQREDDKPMAIKKRLEIYKKESYPLIEHYKKIVHKVNANISIGSPGFHVIEDCMKIIGGLK